MSFSKRVVKGWFRRYISAERLSISIAPSTSKPACRNPSDMPPQPEKRSTAVGRRLRVARARKFPFRRSATARYIRQPSQPLPPEDPPFERRGSALHGGPKNYRTGRALAFLRSVGKLASPPHPRYEIAHSTAGVSALVSPPATKS